MLQLPTLVDELVQGFLKRCRVELKKVDSREADEIKAGR
jgi:hypothetical protein